ncbi:MAG TPA: SMI1/KNR4 family protein [Niabella sp.]|nr:SMI1/KNR4 family protein [Niabella sp.]
MNLNPIVEQYLDGLKERLSEEDKEQLSFTFGATDKQLGLLREHFADCPDSLLDLLSVVNGTYWQQYGEKEVSILILGSDIFEYPYYLKSVEQIIEGSQFDGSVNDIYADYPHEIPSIVGAGIDPEININRWLCFSDCMNNGGTSQLFVDFDPGPGGNKGQVVRFLHDPDSFKVIADSFDDYLQKLMEHNYDFIIEEE